MPLTETSAPSRRLLLPEDLERPFRYATRRNSALATRGGKVAVLAQALGRPLKPHQQYIADVAGELNPPGMDLRFRYQTVIIAEPRQVGKTTLWRPVVLDRCIETPKTAVFMTAQLGKDASARWDDLVKDVEASTVFAEFTKSKRGMGNQIMEFPNGSFVSPFPPNKDALHGESPDLVGIDEGWAFDEEAGRDLMRAIRPAQITRKARQLWVFSAAGNADSEFFNELVEIGRASVNDPSSTIAYFEHSMDPDADPYDPEAWEFHPGLDGLITLADLAEEAKPENNTHADWLRGFMNISTKVRTTTIIDLDTWDDLAADVTLTEPVIAYDVAIDSSAASIYAAALDPDGRVCIKTVLTDEGIEWLAPALRDLHNSGHQLYADDGGPARVITARLQRASIPVTTLSGVEASTAWGEFKADIKARTLYHDGSLALRTALEITTETKSATPAPDRRRSLGPIDAAIAASTAAHAARATNGPQIF